MTTTSGHEGQLVVCNRNLAHCLAGNDIDGSCCFVSSMRRRLPVDCLPDKCMFGFEYSVQYDNGPKVFWLYMSCHSIYQH
jgi:hypothetical protein